MEIDESDLISFFESIPSKMDEDNKVPFYYNFSTFEYYNEKGERVVFSLCPAYGEVRLEIETSFAKTELILENTNLIKIQNDSKHLADILLRTDYLEVYLLIRPLITLRIKEHKNL